MIPPLSFIMLNVILSVAFFAFSIIMPLCVIFLTEQSYSHSEALELFLKYALFFNIGCLFLAGAVGHLLYAQDIAADLGWSWSPFQYELGFSELALASIGMAAPIFSKEFWLATIMASVVWLVGASAVHSYYFYMGGNELLLNATFVVVWNIVVAVWLIILYATYTFSRKDFRDISF